MAKDRELQDHERAHSGKPGATVQHGQPKRYKYHDVADAIKEVRDTPDQYAIDPSTKDPKAWNGYFKWDSEQYGNDRPHRDTVKRALDYLDKKG